MLHHSPASNGGRRVFIAIPCVEKPSPLTMFCLYTSQAPLAEAGFEVELGILPGNCHVDDARNVLVREFLKTDCEQFIFIDADMGWQPKDLVKLANYDRDIVGASYPLKQGLEEFPCRFLGGEMWADSEGLMEVEGIPTGFMKVKRHVLETLFDKSRKFKVRGSDDIEETAEIFNRDIVNGGRMSGDYNFCRKWRATGGKIHVAPEMHMEHAGERVWSGSLGSYLRRKNGLAFTRGLQLIREGKETPSDILELAMDWGNVPYAAGPELIKASIDLARQVGSVTETGSGLTSLVMAAANPECQVQSLEHDKFWYQRTSEAGIGLENLTIHYRPLEAYEGGQWYSGEFPRSDLVICDGPPRTIGNREIIFEHMNGPKCVVFDDASGVTEAMEQWADGRYRFETLGAKKKFTIARAA